jgi:Rrf2 family protein
MLTQAVGYAAVAMGYLAQKADGAALVRTIADDCAIPAPYLSKIINQLARANLVRTQRGVGGGVRLAREPEDVTLLDLCEALHDPAIENRCMLGVADCSDERKCPAHDFNVRRREQLLAFLRATTVADIGAFEAARSRALEEGGKAGSRPGVWVGVPGRGRGGPGSAQAEGAAG